MGHFISYFAYFYFFWNIFIYYKKKNFNISRCLFPEEKTTKKNKTIRIKKLKNTQFRY